MQTSRTNQLLGYPDDARLLIINADDFGMCHAINEGILQSMKDGVVHAASLMTPCPWGLHAMHLLQENPELDFGVHLTLISETVNYGWKPLTPAAQVPSLVNEAGYFLNLPQMPLLIERANLAEVELEFRAQIELVLAAGLKPSNLDWHCLHDGGRADIFELTARLAKEYGLALRVSERASIEKLQAQGLPTNEYPLLDSYGMTREGKLAQYAQLLHDLPVGLSEWAVHPSLNQGELHAIEPDSWWVRDSDYQFALSAEVREIIDREGIILIDYKPLQALWQ